MEVEGVIISEISLKEREKFHELTHIGDIKKQKNEIKCPERNEA